MLRDTPLFATTTEKPPRDAHPWAWVIASIALAVALASTLLWWQQARLHRTLATELRALRAAPASAQSTVPATTSIAATTTGSASAAMPAADRKSANAPEKPVVMSVPYGDAPLTGARLETIRQLFHRLTTEKFQGTVDIRIFPGRFCLVGDAADGYSLAPEELPYRRCDAVGNPDAAELAQREPLSFANLVSELRSATRGAAKVRLSEGDATAMRVPYPDISAGLTAGEWNRAAQSNNRVEVRLR
jgi:hypothetical protein